MYFDVIYFGGKGTFFPRFRLRLRQTIIINVTWIIKAPLTLAATFADITEALAVQAFEYWTHICVIKMTNLYDSLGGAVRIVEIDEIVVWERKFKHMMGHLKKDMFNGLQLKYHLYENMSCRVLQYIWMDGERTDAYIDLVIRILSSSISGVLCTQPPKCIQVILKQYNRN